MGCIRLSLSIIRSNFETNIAKPLNVIKSYKNFKKIIETYQKLTNKLSKLT